MPVHSDAVQYWCLWWLILEYPIQTYCAVSHLWTFLLIVCLVVSATFKKTWHKFSGEPCDTSDAEILLLCRDYLLNKFVQPCILYAIFISCIAIFVARSFYYDFLDTTYHKFIILILSVNGRSRFYFPLPLNIFFLRVIFPGFVLIYGLFMT